MHGSAGQLVFLHRGSWHCRPNATLPSAAVLLEDRSHMDRLRVSPRRNNSRESRLDLLSGRVEFRRRSNDF